MGLMYNNNNNKMIVNDYITVQEVSKITQQSTRNVRRIINRIKEEVDFKYLFKDENSVWNISKDILDSFYEGQAVRLIGIRLDDLTDSSPYQTSLFDNIEKRDKEEKIDKVIDEINKKIGKNVIKKASLVQTDVKRKEIL